MLGPKCFHNVTVYISDESAESKFPVFGGEGELCKPHGADLSTSAMPKVRINWSRILFWLSLHFFGQFPSCFKWGWHLQESIANQDFDSLILILWTNLNRQFSQQIVQTLENAGRMRLFVYTLTRAQSQKLKDQQQT